MQQRTNESTKNDLIQEYENRLKQLKQEANDASSDDESLTSNYHVDENDINKEITILKERCSRLIEKYNNLKQKYHLFVAISQEENELLQNKIQNLENRIRQKEDERAKLTSKIMEFSHSIKPNTDNEEEDSLERSSETIKLFFDNFRNEIEYKEVLENIQKTLNSESKETIIQSILELQQQNEQMSKEISILTKAHEATTKEYTDLLKILKEKGLYKRVIQQLQSDNENGNDDEFNLSFSKPFHIDIQNSGTKEKNLVNDEYLRLTIKQFFLKNDQTRSTLIPVISELIGFTNEQIMQAKRLCDRSHQSFKLFGF